jgi:hypothetical protein
MLFFAALLVFSSEEDRFRAVVFLSSIADCRGEVPVCVSCSDVGLCVAIESGGGEVSSGKVMLHIVVLEKKKFSLAGR